jgi:hypothetical protein
LYDLLLVRGVGPVVYGLHIRFKLLMSRAAIFHSSYRVFGRGAEFLSDAVSLFLKARSK